jgi:integrase
VVGGDAALVPRGDLRRPPPRPVGAAGHNGDARERGDRPSLAGRRPRRRPASGGADNPVKINGKLLTSEPKTAKGQRPIALDPSTVSVLREHGTRMLEERMLVGADFSDEGRAFRRPDGSCLRPETVSSTFLRRQKKLDVPRLTLKGLRHTWATRALEQGIHPRVVQERLGHSTIAITLGIYSHVRRRSTTRPPSRLPG